MRERAAGLLGSGRFGRQIATDRAVIFPEANNSASPSRARWLTIRVSFWPTNQPATSILPTPSAPLNCLQNIVQEGGKALLLATHNPVIAEACDWIHEMKDGLIIDSHPRGSETSLTVGSSPLHR